MVVVRTGIGSLPSRNFAYGFKSIKKRYHGGWGAGLRSRGGEITTSVGFAGNILILPAPPSSSCHDDVVSNQKVRSS
jgi:hypothetical protein